MKILIHCPIYSYFRDYDLNSYEPELKEIKQLSYHGVSAIILIHVRPVYPKLRLVLVRYH